MLEPPIRLTKADTNLYNHYLPSFLETLSILTHLGWSRSLGGKVVIINQIFRLADQVTVSVQAKATLRVSEPITAADRAAVPRYPSPRVPLVTKGLLCQERSVRWNLNPVQGVVIINVLVCVKYIHLNMYYVGLLL